MRHSAIVAVASAAVVLTSLPSVAAAGDVVPRIPNAPVFDAPIGKQGGIMTPTAYCTGYQDDPTVESTITNTSTGQSRSFSWTGTYPGYGFPRVKVGEYSVLTSATCDGVTRSRTEIVTVKQKTAMRTVSWKEWKRIKRGMSPKQVARIIGYPGVDSGRYQRATHRQYDMMAFWRWSIITYRHGHVVGKDWNVDHD